MLYHRCEKKVYPIPEAKQHPHANNPAICLNGWRKATAKEVKAVQS